MRVQKPKTKLSTPIYEVEGYESSRGRELPPIDQWRKYFPHEKETSTRISLRNPDTTDALANALVPEGSQGKIIIESDPGSSFFVDESVLKHMEQVPDSSLVPFSNFQENG